VVIANHFKNLNLCAAVNLLFTVLNIVKAKTKVIINLDVQTIVNQINKKFR